MLCLFETPAGFALFEVLKEKKLADTDAIWQQFQSLEKASSFVKLKAFSKFDNTTDALAAAANLVRTPVPSTANLLQSMLRCIICHRVPASRRVYPARAFCAAAGLFARCRKQLLRTHAIDGVEQVKKSTRCRWSSGHRA